MQAFLLIIATIVTIGIVSIAGTYLKLFILPWLKFATKVDTNQKIIQKTYNSDNVIYNYEWFKDRYEAIQAVEIKIKNAETAYSEYKTIAGEQKTWTFEDKTEIARLNAVVLGLKNHKEDLVAEYNSRAKQVNRNIFQENLPLFIDLK